MESVADAKRSAEERLIVDERHMRCPRCREVQDVLSFIPMGVIEAFSTETNPIYKCRLCHWAFSPREAPSEVGLYSTILRAAHA